MQIVFCVYEARNGHGFWFHCLVRGLPTDSSLLKLGLLKIVLDCLLVRKRQCVICMNLLKNEWLELCEKQYVNAWNLMC